LQPLKEVLNTLMEQKQETKSLPRNRKCGNCRYFEPAPLWRKGWCRNPRLYDRRANHLVDASSIDCEQVFRARIYWEPIPTTELPDNKNVHGNIANHSADGGGDAGSKLKEGILRPKGQNWPVINREAAIPDREKTEALPGMIKQPSQTRKWLLENIPYYDKIDGPISRVPWGIVLPAVIIGLALIIILANVFGGSKPQVAANTTTAPTDKSTTAAVAVTTTSGAKTTASGAPVATPTLSTALPTATPEPAKTTTATTEKKAKVINTGTSKSVNLRKDPSTKDDKNILARIPEGAEVTIVGPPQFAEGKEWWQVSYKGQVGFAAKDYLQPVN
jgi:hypothetical protein